MAIHLTFRQDRCKGCGLCVTACPKHILALEGGANVKGYETYRYYEGNDILRSWICMPLIVGIYDRAAATIDALFRSDLYPRTAF